LCVVGVRERVFLAGAPVNVGSDTGPVESVPGVAGLPWRQLPLGLDISSSVFTAEKLDAPVNVGSDTGLAGRASCVAVIG
jgi:hypothetical protein